MNNILRRASVWYLPKQECLSWSPYRAFLSGFCMFYPTDWRVPSSFPCEHLSSHNFPVLSYIIFPFMNFNFFPFSACFSFSHFSCSFVFDDCAIILLKVLPSGSYNIDLTLSKQCLVERIIIPTRYGGEFFSHFTTNLLM